ncbi:MAG: hypothetical protein QM791_02550 [Ferruginibacter sp.]
MRNEYKKMIACCFFLYMALWLFDAAVTFAVKKSTKGQLGKVNKILSHNDVPSVAVFGSSVGEVGVNTSLINHELNQSAYNYSINGTWFYQYRGLIKDFNKHNDQTKTVIMAETYFSLSAGSGISSVERYVAHISNPDVYAPLYQIQPGLAWKCRYVPFYKYVAVSSKYYVNAFDGLNAWLKKNTGTDTLLGQAPVFRSWEADQDEAIKNTKPFTISIDSAVVTAYRNCVRELKQSGKNVIIVLTPVYTEVSKLITDFTPVRVALQNIAAAEKVEFWDYTLSDICSNKNFFYNSNHLNWQGSLLFTGDLVRKIKSMPGRI